MSYRIPYPYLLNIGVLESTDIIPILRPAFNEGSATVADIAAYVNPYNVYRVDMSQVGAGDPTVEYEYENSIGSIAWTYTSAGTYNGNLTGAFTGLVPNQTKTFFNIAVTSGSCYYTITKIDDDNILMEVRDKTWILVDGFLNYTFIDFIIYPALL